MTPEEQARLREGVESLLAKVRAGASLDPADSTDADYDLDADIRRSEEHTSEIQSLMRTSYAGFCLKKKTDTKKTYVDTERRHPTTATMNITASKGKTQHQSVNSRNPDSRNEPHRKPRNQHANPHTTSAHTTSSLIPSSKPAS